MDNSSEKTVGSAVVFGKERIVLEEGFTAGANIYVCLKKRKRIFHAKKNL